MMERYQPSKQEVLIRVFSLLNHEARILSQSQPCATRKRKFLLSSDVYQSARIQLSLIQ